MSFNIEALPRELHDQIWEATLGIEGPALIQCLEVDLLAGLDPEAPESLWFAGLHKPAVYPPRVYGGGRGTFDASWFLHVRNVAASGIQARRVLEHLQSVLGSKARADLLELEVESHPLDRDAAADKVSVWLNTKRDIMLLQTPSNITDRFLAANFGHTDLWSDWFSPTWWSWSPHAAFRPLPFFGLDRVERFAIDWEVETTRGNIRPLCGRSVCRNLRRFYHNELYHTPREMRRYCSSCLGRKLDGLNEDIKNVPPDAHWWQALNHPWPSFWDDGDGDDILGFDEQGTFKCQSCRADSLCTSGRLPEIVNKVPHPEWKTGWQPTCHSWHDPRFQGDIETLLMGRMPSLKTFYIIDSGITLHQTPTPAPWLTEPHEEFEGCNCKFVEVNPRDPAWNLSSFRPMSGAEDIYGFHSFGYADRLRTVAWTHASNRHAQALLDEERANRDPDATSLDDHAEIMWWRWARARAAIPLDKVAFDAPMVCHPTDDWKLGQLQGPGMGQGRTLEGEWPDNLLPVKVKILARIDPGEYWRLAPVKA